MSQDALHISCCWSCCACPFSPSGITQYRGNMARTSPAGVQVKAAVCPAVLGLCSRLCPTAVLTPSMQRVLGKYLHARGVISCYTDVPFWTTCSFLSQCKQIASHGLIFQGEGARGSACSLVNGLKGDAMAETGGTGWGGAAARPCCGCQLSETGACH